MKKMLLSLAVVASGYWVQAQVVVNGISPAAVQGNYDFGVQANCGTWPGETDDGTWNVLSNIDFNIPGNFIEDTLMMVDDGSSGTNAQGNPVSAEGCGTLQNDLTGKIAVIYRNTCEFGTKVYNAQQAGAVAAIIINRENAIVSMLGGTDGPNVTIPCVFLSDIDGATLVNAMAGGPVVVFIGNKLGVNANDLSSYKENTLISPFRTSSNIINNGFDVGIELYNYGANAQTPTVNAQIVGPGSTTYYDETVVGPNMLSGDTLPIFPGNPYSFPRFDMGLGNYPNGTYTLTYTITGSLGDDATYDNVFVSDFEVTDSYLSYASNNGAGEPDAGSFPTASEKPSEQQTCMFVADSLADFVTVTGITFVPYADTANGATMAGSEIFVIAYQWDDGWTDLNDPNYWATGAPNDPYANVESNALDFVSYIPLSDNEVGLPVFLEFNSPIALSSAERYLFCVQTFDTNVVFGYNTDADYNANVAIYAMPVSVLKLPQASTTQDWYALGWGSGYAPSMTLHVGTTGLDENNTVDGKAYPNPAVDQVTIQLDATGNAMLNVADISGKLVASETVTLDNGKAVVNIAGLDSGVYIFNVETESGATAQFNVIKK